MGRTLKRVPLDFEWPKGKVWKGYINPYRVSCITCKGRGITDEHQYLEDFVSYLTMAGEDSWIRPDDYKAPESYLATPSITNTDAFKSKWPWPHLNVVDTILKAAKMGRKDITDLDCEIITKLARLRPPHEKFEYGYAVAQSGTHKVKSINRYSGDHGIKFYPHPSLGELGVGDVGDNFYKIVKALGAKTDTIFGWDGKWDITKNIYRAVGIPSVIVKKEWGDWEEFDWGNCPAGCDGGIALEYIEAFNKWESYDPPTGEGFQLWETTSEGSPQSPVFKTLHELCAWCEFNASVFGHSKASKNEWLRMLDADFVHHTQGNITFI